MHIESLDPRRLLATGLDTTFADDGTLSFPATFKPKTDAAHSVESGDKGSLFVAGSDGDKYYVAKVDKNGKPVTTFGTNSYARVPFEPDRLAYDTTSGTLYVAGNDMVPGTDGNGRVQYTPSYDTRVIRLRATGALDRAFGKRGRVPVPPARAHRRRHVRPGFHRNDQPARRRLGAFGRRPRQSLADPARPTRTWRS